MNFNKSLAKGPQDQVTDTTEVTGNQAEGEKFYTQKEVDDMMAGLKSSVIKKALKPQIGRAHV